MEIEQFMGKMTRVAIYLPALLNAFGSSEIKQNKLIMNWGLSHLNASTRKVFTGSINFISDILWIVELT